MYEKININEIYAEREKQSTGSVNKDDINNNENLMILNTLDLDDNNLKKPFINHKQT